MLILSSAPQVLDRPSWIAEGRHMDASESSRRSGTSVGYWIGYTFLGSFVRAGKVRRSPWRTEAPQAFHRRVQAADSRARKRGEARGGRDARVRPVEEHRRQVGQVDQRRGIAACRRQPHARAEPGDRAGAREPQAAHGGRRFKADGADIRTKATAMAANADRYPASAQCEIPGVARPARYFMRSR